MPIDPVEGVTFNETGSCGVVVAGLCTDEKIPFDSRGVSVGGESLVASGYFGIGGIEFGGSAIIQYVANPKRPHYDIDYFADSTGTFLQDHQTVFLGNSWSQSGDTTADAFYIDPSGSVNTDSTSQTLAYIDYDATTLTVKAKTTIRNQSGYSYFSLVFYLNDENNFLHAQISPDNANFRVFRRLAGLDSEIGSMPLFGTPNELEEWRIEVVVTPTTIDAYAFDNLDRSKHISLSHSFTPRTSYGIMSNVSGETWKEFSAEDLGGAEGSGVLVAGDSDINKNESDFIIAHGVVIAGDSDISSFYYPPDGAVVVSGEAEVQYGLVGDGGAVVGGSALITFYDYVDGSGGVVVEGISNVNTRRNIPYFPHGRLVRIGGSYQGGINPVYNATGSVEVGGSSLVNLTFDSDITFLWNVRSSIIRDLTFIWNLGRLPIFWYRVIGKCRDGSKCNLIADPCGQKFVANVHARSLTELCDKLRSRRFILPIESVQRFSTPAEQAVALSLEAAGQDLSCNELTPVEICQIPACFDFCVDFDVRVSFKFDIIRVQIDAFFEHEAEDKVILYVGGCADVVLWKNLPAFYHVAEGGIAVNHTSRVTASDYTVCGDGGLAVAGSSDRASSNWEYCGGLWPSETKVKFAGKNSTESILQDLEDQIWSLTDRIRTNNSLFASSDISFGKTSEFLVARNFEFDIPAGTQIRGIKVLIDRLTTQVNVKDEEVYLVIGNDVVTDNMAKLTDWPFVETTAAYGDDGFSGEPWRDPDAYGYIPWDASEINNPEFGVALRVKANSSLPITIAKVDFISVQVFYEVPEQQKLRISGQSDVVSTTWKYESSGGLRIEGTVGVPPYGIRYISKGGVNISGHSGIHYVGLGSGGISVGGEAIERYEKLHFLGSGGAVLDGTALVVPIYLDFDGGVAVGGEAEINSQINEKGIGGIELSGIFSISHYKYESTGGVFMHGTSSIVSSVWTHTSEGGVAIDGDGDLGSSHLGLFIESIGFQMSITDLEVAFDSDVHEGDATILPNSVAQCGCTTIPFKINFEQNLARRNNFSQFLTRNNLNLPSRFQMYYNVPNNSWQQNFHFKGFSPNAPTKENWDIVFELQCTNLMGGIAIGRDVWRLAIEIFRRNLDTGEDFDTRIMFGVYKEPICDTAGNNLSFKITYDTQADIAEIDPTSTIYQTLLFDNIGLFKSPYWTKTSNLILSVSEAGFPIDQIRVDLTDEVLL